MILMLRPMTSVISFGAEHSTLGPLVERAAKLAGLEVVPDPNPEEVVFVRSDQFSFVRQGLPAVFPVSGSDGTPDGFAEQARWRKTCYHSPCDDMNQVFDWDSGAKFARMMFLATWMAADSPSPPRWTEGDFFGRRFGPRP
jgi:Zn-dependent M28 family amino/carboxypeptidase